MKIDKWNGFKFKLSQKYKRYLKINLILAM